MVFTGNLKRWGGLRRTNRILDLLLEDLMVLLLLVQHMLLLGLLQGPLIHLPPVHLLQLLTLLLQLLDAAAVAHFFQVSFEGLDACSPV